CQAAYAVDTPEKNEARKRWASTRQETHRRVVEEYLRVHHCVDCGNTDLHVKEFDHVRGTKLFNLTDGWTKSIEAVSAEMEKCEVRCVNCHLRVTESRRETSLR